MINRLIKFRIWTGVEFLYIEYIPTLGFVPTTNKKEKISFGEEPCQQFTGLKDNTGRDIYEGDILRCKGYEDWGDNVGYYYNFAIEFEIKPSGESDLSGFLYIPKDREIVGNVFENHNLLDPVK